MGGIRVPGPEYTSYTDNASGVRTSAPKYFILGGQKYAVNVSANLKDGHVVDSQYTLQKEITTKSGKEYVDYAVTSDGGKTWKTPGSKGSVPITSANTGLSASEIKSLQPGGALNKASKNAATQSVRAQGANPNQAAAAVNGQSTKPQNPENKDQSKPSVDISKEVTTREGTNSGLPGSGGQLKYPRDLNPKQDCVIFTQLEYSPRALSATDTSEGNPLQLGQRSSDRKLLGSIRLPIQSGIADLNTVSWGEDRMNAIDLFKINIAKQTITGGFKEGAQTVQEGTKTALADLSSEKASIVAAIQQAVTGKNTLARAQGAVVNENLELLFQGPQLRSFSFSFKLSARSDQEAKDITNIIRFFKQGMATQRTKNEYFLKSPNTFNINYLHNGEEHKGINKIKECALLSCNVNYTPDGFYAAHSDGYLVSYEMTMQFQELEPVYNDEYANLKDSIGY